MEFYKICDYLFIWLAAKILSSRFGAIGPASPVYERYFFIHTLQTRPSAFISLETTLWLQKIALFGSSAVILR